jgi:hypothetical protein
MTTSAHTLLSLHKILFSHTPPVSTRDLFLRALGHSLQTSGYTEGKCVFLCNAAIQIEEIYLKAICENAKSIVFTNTNTLCLTCHFQVDNNIRTFESSNFSKHLTGNDVRSLFSSLNKTHENTPLYYPSPGFFPLELSRNAAQKYKMDFKYFLPSPYFTLTVYLDSPRPYKEFK